LGEFRKKLQVFHMRLGVRFVKQDSFSMVVRFFGLLLLLAGFARADSITIGQIQFLGTFENGVSVFKVTLDTTGITAGPLAITDLFLSVQGISSEGTGAITTPAAFLFLGGSGFGLPACPCDSATVTLIFSSSNQAITLANGTLFTAKGTSISILSAGAGGQLQPGDSAPIVLTPVPEPATLLFVATGVPLMTRRLLYARGGPRKTGDS
jgi:hypothetical protein